MIKNLSLKFVLVFLVLVVSVFITSTCYALRSFTKVDISDCRVSMDEIKQVIKDNGYDSYLNGRYVVYGSTYEHEQSSLYIKVFKNEEIIYLKEHETTADCMNFFNSSDVKIASNYLNINFSGVTFNSISEKTNQYNFHFTGLEEMYKCDFDVYNSSGTLIYTADSLEPIIDTSFDYSLNGIKRGQVELKINNLDSSLRMYGYVGCENNFNIGDTLDTSSISSYLRLLAMYSDNSDLDCYLYDGEELLYYIVDENNVILNFGYISEMAKGDFLYGFNVYNGVDFVFLKDGEVYWDNDLTFKYSIGSSSQYKKNDIVSMAQSSYITTDKTIASSTYNGYVYDTDGNLISQASVINSNDLSGISISVDTAYTENNVGWNKSCYWLMSFELDGTNVDGSFIDFSNYYAKWSVPTWLNLDSIEINGEEYTKRNGVITGFTSSGYSGMFNLKIFELIKNHISNFDIKLDIYDGNDNLVLTHIINSDDIVKNQVASEENNVDKGDYDILDNPNFTGGSSNNVGNIGDINNIQNWTADDYLNLMSTDNFVWEFFKAILGNLPWWITTPLTILIFGVVIITIIRFARGA